jgi:replication factor C subunit 1
LNAYAFNAAQQKSIQRQQMVQMNLISHAAESISDGDLLDGTIREQQQFSLLPSHGVLSTIRPAFFLQGQFRGVQGFPSWMGKYQTTKKNYRLLNEVRSHMYEFAAGTSSDVCLNYLPAMRIPLSKPMLEQNQAGIDSVIQLMDCYGINREDWVSIFDLTTLAGFSDPSSRIQSATKSAFTRIYNKSHVSLENTAKKKSKSDAPNLALGDDEDEPAYDSEDDEDKSEDANDSLNDKLVKCKKLVLKDQNSTSEKSKPKSRAKPAARSAKPAPKPKATPKTKAK